MRQDDEITHMELPQSRFRRRYSSVLAESFGKTVIEESELENNSNGSAGIPPSARVLRMAVNTLAKFFHQNSLNLSNSNGEKWEALTPLGIWRDKGVGNSITCNYPGCD